jgi:hypothetical protein
MLRTLTVLLAAALLFPAAAFADDPAVPPHKEFVVHEWAVWVKGASLNGTVLSSPAQLVAGLPKFVQTLKDPRQPTTPAQPKVGQKAIPGGPMWNKPVLHLYGEEGMDVRISVTTAQGLLSAYWPAGKRLGVYLTTFGTQAVRGIEWSGTLQGKPDGKVGEPPKDHWWSAVREVSSMYFVADKQCERFLFYEGTAMQEPAVTATISADQLKLTNSGGDPTGQVMVIVHSGDKWYYRVLDAIKGGGEAVISKAEFLAKEFSEDQLLEACRSHWQQFGMTQAEAKAIVKSWEPDLLHPWQILVISRMPAELYEKMFPLTVSPKPDKLVRVGVVFDRLKGKSCANIVPGLSDHIKDLREQAKADDQQKSKQAKSTLDELGVGE